MNSQWTYIRLTELKPAMGPGEPPEEIATHYIAGTPIDPASDDALPWSVDMHAAFDGTRMVVDRLAVSAPPDAPPITSEALRSVPVARLLRSALTDHHESFTDRLPPDVELTRRQLAELEDEYLRFVADVYRYAAACGEPPVQAVARRLSIPSSTAAKRVMEARRRQYLPAAVHAGAGRPSKAPKEAR